MKKIKILLITLIFFSSFFYNCKKDDSPKNNALAGKSFVVNATSQTKWAYFSFSTGDTLEVADPAHSTSWDIAFQRFNIKSNSGKSGNGMGGVFKTAKSGNTDFNAFTLVPDTAEYAIDDTIVTTGAMGRQIKTIANSAFLDWYDYNQTSYLLVSKSIIYIIKTADGKYAKFMILNYYNDASTPAYVKFQYFYQPDGSKKLE